MSAQTKSLFEDLYVWVYLPGRESPEICGVLALQQGRVASFEYDPNWLSNQQAFPLAPDLPLMGVKFDPPVGCEIHPIFEDAGPDRWGRAVINKVFNPQRRSVLDYLILAGDNRVGCLAFSESREQYDADVRAVYSTSDLQDLYDAASALADHQPISEEMLRLLQPGSSPGGARPKALVRHLGQEWIAKFRSPNDEVDFCAVEHASLRLASDCGLRVVESELIALNGANAVLVRRFDRENGHRHHFASARAMLISEGVKSDDMGYPDIADFLRSKGEDPLLACRELFSRMVFNIAIENTDDHEKNHGFLMKGSYWQLSPAFDMQPQLQGLGYQQLRVGKDGSTSSLQNAISDCGRFMLKPKQAIEIAHEIVKNVANWKDVFAAHGVTDADIAACGSFVLRPSVVTLQGALADQKPDRNEIGSAMP